MIDCFILYLNPQTLCSQNCFLWVLCRAKITSAALILMWRIRAFLVLLLLYELWAVYNVQQFTYCLHAMRNAAVSVKLFFCTFCSSLLQLSRNIEQMYSLIFPIDPHPITVQVRDLSQSILWLLLAHNITLSFNRNEGAWQEGSYMSKFCHSIKSGSGKSIL